MSVTIVLPDHVKSCRELLLGNATLVHTPVATVIDELRDVYITEDAWINYYIPNPEQLPRNAIRVQGAGGLGPRLPGYESQRVQFDCFGTTKALALTIANLVKMILWPVQENMQGWTAASTRVTQTLTLTGPLPGIEPGSDPPAHYMTITAELEVAREGRT